MLDEQHSGTATTICAPCAGDISISAKLTFLLEILHLLFLCTYAYLAELQRFHATTYN